MTDHTKAQADTDTGKPAAGGSGFGARAGSSIRGNLFRGSGGQFQAGPGAALQNRLAELRAKRLNKGKPKGKAKAAPKGKGKAAPKDARTPQEKANQSRAAVAKETGMADLEGVMVRLGAGMDSDLEKDAHEKLIGAGLAKRGADGSVALTPAGKKWRGAADKGDADGARAALAEGKEHAAAGAAKDKVRGDRVAVREKKLAEKKKAKAAKPKQKKDAKPAAEKKPGAAAEQREKERITDRAQRQKEHTQDRAQRQVDRTQRQKEHAEDRAQRQTDRAGRDKQRADRETARAKEKQDKSKTKQPPDAQRVQKGVADEVARIDAARGRGATKQTDQERAMFAAMGSSGTLRKADSKGNRTGPKMGKPGGSGGGTASDSRAALEERHDNERRFLETSHRTDMRQSRTADEKRFLETSYRTDMRELDRRHTEERQALRDAPIPVREHAPTATVRRTAPIQRGGTSSSQRTGRVQRRIAKTKGANWGRRLSGLRKRLTTVVRGAVSVVRGKETKDTPMSDYTPILDDLKAIGGELAVVGDDALAAVKAGARHSGGDIQMIQGIADAASDILDLAVELGAADPDADEEEPDEDDADMADDAGTPDAMKMAAGDPVAYAYQECAGIQQATAALQILAQLAASEASEQDTDTPAILTQLRQAMIIITGYINGEIGELKAAPLFGSKKRDDLEDEDFAGPGRTYPIMTAKDVTAAASLIGKADDPDTVKKRIIAIAKRKGFEDALPESWKDGGATKKSLDPYAVKMLDDDTVYGPAIRFGSADEPDLSKMRDYFTKSTDYWLDAWDKRPMIWHHAIPQTEILDEIREAGATEDEIKAMREALDYLDAHPVVGVWTKATIDPTTVWMQGQVSKAHRYRNAVKRMIDMGLLKISTDSAPHLVQRIRQPNGTHEVKRWPIIAASLTPTAAEPRLYDVSAMKAFYDEAGIPMPELPDEDTAKQSIELELLAIEMEMLALTDLAA